MKVGIVNLMTRTADLDTTYHRLFGREGLAPGDESELNIVRTAERMARRGHEVVVFVADPYTPKRRAVLPDGLRVEYLPIVLPFPFSPSLAPLTPSLGRAVRAGELDVLQSGEVFQPGTVLSWQASRRRSAFFIWQELDIRMSGIASPAQGLFYRTMGRSMARQAQGLISRSLSAQQHLRAEGLTGEYEGVVHSGIDTSTFSPAQRESCREGFGLAHFEDVLLMVGRMHVNKGMDIAIRAIKRLREERKECCLVIKGNGPQKQELQQLVNTLGVAENVRFIPEHLSEKDMARLYSAADSLLVTSRTDLFPFSAIEAISCGTPIATSFGRGLKTDITDRGAGVILPSEPERIGEELASCLDDKAGLRRLGSAGRQLAEEEFDVEVSVSRLLDIYGRHLL